MPMASLPTPPWYKQFWPWFIIALLGSSVIFSLIYLVASIRYFDGTVAQDYYRRGLAINEQLAKQERADQLGLAARLRVDDLTGDVIVDLEGQRRPEQLHLAWIFPTEHGRDRHLTLQRVQQGRYVGTLDAPLRYRWYLHLQPTPGDDAAWRLTGEARFPHSGAIALTPGI